MKEQTILTVEVTNAYSPDESCKSSFLILPQRDARPEPEPGSAHAVRTWFVLWVLLETTILTSVTFAGGFIGEPLNGYACSFTCFSVWWPPLPVFSGAYSLAGSLMILGVAFLMGYFIADWSVSVKAYLAVQAVSFAIYIPAFLLIPSFLSVAAFSQTTYTGVAGPIFVILTYLLWLGLVIVLVGGVLTMTSAVLAERNSQPRLRPL